MLLRKKKTIKFYLYGGSTNSTANKKKIVCDHTLTRKKKKPNGQTKKKGIIKCERELRKTKSIEAPIREVASYTLISFFFT